MRRRVALAALVLLAASPAHAAETPERKLARLTRGRVAGTPVDCIRPEWNAQPVIVGHEAIVFYAPGAVYVTRPAGRCPELREDGQLRTRSLSGQICRKDQFQVALPPGPSGTGLCAFGPFVPYTRTK